MTSLCKLKADMKKAATFASWGDAITADGSDTSAVWRIYEGNTMPLLTAFMTASMSL